MKAACIGLATFLVGILAGPARPALADDVQRLADLDAELTAGHYEKAAAEAKAILGEASDADAIVEARRILAESLRKQGNWRAASGAYIALSRACPEGSEDRVRYEAIGEVLRTTNREGIYGPAVANGEKRKLSDDEALEEALATWAEFQCKQFKSFCSRLRRARSPADVVKIVRPAAEDARVIFLVAPDTPADGPRRVAQAANAKLDRLCKAARGALERKLHKYEYKMENPWAFTNVEKRDLENTRNLCNQMSSAEQVFLESLTELAGPGTWPEAGAIRAASADRRATYNELAGEFEVPEWIEIGGSWW